MNAPCQSVECTSPSGAELGLRSRSRVAEQHRAATAFGIFAPGSAVAPRDRVHYPLSTCKVEAAHEWYSLHVDVARPYAAVAPGIEGEALVVLAGTTAPLTGRQIARLARRGTSPSVSAALDRLVDQGLVHRQEAGRAYLHTLNRDHIAAPAVELLAGLRAELLRRLRDTLRSWQPASLHASMFGSAARADGDTSSDIDLLVIRPGDVGEEDAAWRAQVDALGESVHAWTGNHAGIVELGEADIADLRRKPPPILGDLRADGIDLAGLPVRALFKEHR
jgi:DNA-binding transcriptional ArsR family regulator